MKPAQQFIQPRLHRQPIEKAVEGPGVWSIEVAAYHAREAVGHLKEEARFQTWTVFALILAGFCSGSLRNVLLLYPAGVGVEQPASTILSRYSPRPSLLRRAPRLRPADREEAWAALKAGYGFDAQALGTSKSARPAKPQPRRWGEI